jgi:hypothetical protein
MLHSVRDGDYKAMNLVVTPFADLPAAAATAIALTTKTIAAVNRSVATWDEREASLPTARTAHRDMHLALTATAAAVATATASAAAVATTAAIPAAATTAAVAATATAAVATAATVAARVVRATAPPAARAARLAARPASLRFVRELTFRVERLLACGEHEWCPAIDARQCLVLETHACNPWPLPAYPRRLSASVRQPFRNGIASTSMQVAKSDITMPASGAPLNRQRSGTCADYSCSALSHGHRSRIPDCGCESLLQPSQRCLYPIITPRG